MLKVVLWREKHSRPADRIEEKLRDRGIRYELRIVEPETRRDPGVPVILPALHVDGKIIMSEVEIRKQYLGLSPIRKTPKR